MLSIKQFITRFLFSVEILIFTLIYIFGQNGLLVIMQSRQANLALRKEIIGLNEQTIKLTQTKNKIKSDDFYKEELARNLQMAYPNDEIYAI